MTPRTAQVSPLSGDDQREVSPLSGYTCHHSVVTHNALTCRFAAALYDSSLGVNRTPRTSLHPAAVPLSASGAAGALTESPSSTTDAEGVPTQAARASQTAAVRVT